LSFAFGRQVREPSATNLALFGVESERKKKNQTQNKFTFGNQNNELSLKKSYAALIILPPLIQRVQTFLRPFPPVGS
jgi:hypothetical protein